MKLFIDTNILFDYAFEESAHHFPAKGLIDQAPKLGHELFTSPYSYLTAFYSLRRHLGTANTAQFLYQMSHRVLIENGEVHQNLQQHLLRVAIAGTGDIEDLYQQDIAVALKADAVITRDRQFIQQCQETNLAAYLPDVFLAGEL